MQPKSPEEWLAPLTAEQIHCLEQITEKTNVVYIELQEDRQFIGLGYTAPDGIYAAMLYLDQDQSCRLEFQDKLSDLQDVFDNKYTPGFESIRRMELTGDEIPEIFIWLDHYGAPRLSNTLFIFYSKQNDGSYKKVYSTFACLGWSSLEFIEVDNDNRPMIRTVDDVRCSGWRGKLGTSHDEFFLTNDGRELIRGWNEGLD